MVGRSVGVAWGSQDVGVLGQPVVQLARGRELGQAPLDYDVAQDVFVDPHLGVELTEGFWTEGKVDLPDLGL
jgi:hypothetical protein